MNAQPETKIKRKHPLAMCEEWQGRLSPEGYGVIGGGWQKLYAHRVAWEEVYGKIPPDHVIHHKCRNRKCVNLDHLELMTYSAHQQLRHGVCRNGHIKSPDNVKVIIVKNGPARHECIECRKARGLQN